MHLPQVLLLSRHAGVEPLQLWTKAQPLPSSAHCSTELPLQRLSPGVHATHLPARHTAVEPAQASWFTHSPASLQSWGTESEQRELPGLQGLQSPATQNVLFAQEALWLQVP